MGAEGYYFSGMAWYEYISLLLKSTCDVILLFDRSIISKEWTV
jgi:hypothetical protein